MKLIVQYEKLVLQHGFLQDLVTSLKNMEIATPQEVTPIATAIVGIIVT